MFGRTGLIAARLGISKRTVQIHRARWRKGLYKCKSSEDCPYGGCMKDVIKIKHY